MMPANAGLVVQAAFQATQLRSEDCKCRAWLEHREVTAQCAQPGEATSNKE